MLSSGNREKKKKADSESLSLARSIWNSYSQAKIDGANINDQTSIFFGSISSSEKKEFHSSTKRIIQFGVCTGSYLKAFCLSSPRTIIGYDFSETAIKQIDSTGIKSRLIDLNELDEDQSMGLTYQPTLEADLSEPSDLLLIRMLEYLHPEALKLLIFALINLAKPGSKFYFEIFSSSKKEMVISGGITLHHNLTTGYVPSFFGPRTDIQFVSHKITHDEESDENNDAETTTVERFIVQKR